MPQTIRSNAKSLGFLLNPELREQQGRLLGQLSEHFVGPRLYTGEVLRIAQIRAKKALGAADAALARLGAENIPLAELEKSAKTAIDRFQDKLAQIAEAAAQRFLGVSEMSYDQIIDAAGDGEWPPRSRIQAYNLMLKEAHANLRAHFIARHGLDEMEMEEVLGYARAKADAEAGLLVLVRMEAAQINMACAQARWEEPAEPAKDRVSGGRAASLKARRI